MKVPLYRHNLHGHDIDAIGEEFKQVIRGMILSTGEVCKEMQTEFASYMKTKYCLLTNNWTNAAIATLLALDIGPGDEVIIPTLTFAATANVVEAVGARPVLVDCNDLTKLMSLDLIQKITPRTKAIIPVHLYGQMVDIAALRNIIPPQIAIIEDAAHAIEAERNGYKPGAFSDAAIFSFYSSKNITTGEGGAVVTNNADLHQRIMTIYRHGIDLDGYKRHISTTFREPEVVTRGIKGNMPDTQALLLRPQLKNIAKSNALRTAHAMRYADELKDIVEMPYTMFEAKHAWHIFAVGVDPERRADIINELDNRGIRTAIHFKPIHQQKYFNEKYYPNWTPDLLFPNASDWGKKTISLPLFPDLTEDEQTYVIETLRDIITR